jgi:hypothetical protein
MEDTMRQTVLFALVAAVATGTLMIGPAAAVSIGGPQIVSLKSAASQGSLIEKASYRCWRWREKCAWRWGVDTPRFNRCLVRHGC